MVDTYSKGADSRKLYKKNHGDGEDPIIIAQRFLNIFRQLHIFSTERKEAFNKMILEQPPEIRGMFGSLPGGSVLQKPPLREISADPCDDFAASKTEYKKTEIRENDLSADGYDATFFSNRIKGNIDYDILSEYKVDKAKLDELIRLMTDVCCGTAPMVRIGGSEYRRQDVAERFLSLDDAHIEYVMDKLESGTANVKNMRAYALTVLYNAPATMELDLERQLRHDFACNA